LTRSITAKVTQIDYEKMEARAGQQTVSEWARGVLLQHLTGPDPFQVALMAEFWSLRYILINNLPGSNSNVLREWVEDADARKADKARTILKAVTR